MKPATTPIRTQISLSLALKQLIEAKEAVTGEGLSKYFRKAALIRLVLEETEQADLKLVADAVVGSVSLQNSGWKNERDIAEWQRKERRHEDRHRP